MVRIEEAGKRFAAELGLRLAEGAVLATEQQRMLAARMADRLFEAVDGGRPRVDGTELLRLDPLTWREPVAQVSFSGGVAEYVFGGDTKSFGDLGLVLAQEVRARSERRGLQLVRPDARIRATVIGASQFTVQVSGKTIYLPDADVLPVHNIPVVHLGIDFAGNMDTCIALRTVVIQDGTAYVQVGAGIVADSVPALEYDPQRNRLNLRRGAASADLVHRVRVEVTPTDGTRRRSSPSRMI